jgi:cytoskeletal protein RodZ
MASFGEELRRERELRDISLKEIAEATNIPIRFLEALEQNSFSVLPGGAYNRGFIRSYARHIGVNVSELIDAYHQELARQQEIGQIQREAGSSAPSAASARGVLGAFLAGAFVLAAVVIGIVYWTGASARSGAPEPGLSAHGATLKARVKKSGTFQSTPAPAEAPAADAAPPSVPETAVPEAAAAAAGPAPPAEGETLPRLLRIRVRETTRVAVVCAGVVQHDRDLWVGAERHFPCREPILLSAGNGGAVEYSIDASPSQYLGTPGEIVRDRMVTVPRPAASPAEPDPRRHAAPAGGAGPPRGDASGTQAAGTVS